MLDVNQTRWCEASLNLALCDGPRASSDRCVEFWNASNSQGCVVCICTVWLLALLIALHARWLGLSLAKAYPRLTNLCRKCEAIALSTHHSGDLRCFTLTTHNPRPTAHTQPPVPDPR